MKLFGFRIVTAQEWQELQDRVTDLEKHFVVERDPETARATKTLDQVPVGERAKLRAKNTLRGASWPQTRRWLEQTDGGRTQS